MMAMRALLVWLALAASAAHAAGVAPDMAADPALEARVNQLSAELRCLVCQNQSLADSNAALALQLKAQVREQLGNGRSEKQVIDYMTARYGDFVLYRPPLKASTVLLWTGPALLVIAGIGALALGLRRRASQPDLSDEDRARAAALLEP